uniref:AAA+ ATPase domain-containing protein n=1 Tax=Lygus hesperus TaxID=30085 RepID=A0A0K8SFU5_LYGHE
MVHDPPPTDPEEKKKRSPNFEEIKMKLRISLSGSKDKKKKKKSEKPADYDVIVCESIEETVVVENGVEEPQAMDMTSAPKDVSSQFVDLVDENSNSTPVSRKVPKLTVKMKHDGTLASFFTIGNRVPKPMYELSEEQKQAKLNFLQSGSPANLKKIVASSGSQTSGTPTPLPKVSHVRQKDPMHIIWNLPSVELKTKTVDTTVSLPPWSSVAHLNAPTKGVHESFVQPKFDQKSELKQLKKEANGHPVAVWFKDLREMKKNNDGLIWSEKYKPKSVVHLSLSTVRNVEKLQNWLVTMRDNTKKEESEAYNSEDDFIVGDESCDSVVRFKRAALITGPSGIGKTAIVYAVATELGYEVLELNASANRSGKRILHEFSEALQSHKVEANHIRDLVGKKGSKKMKDVPKLPKHSLILIEDADLVFSDNDDGFLSTAATLAASSKRPVVFIANERGCKHLLSKIAPHLEIDLHFSSLRHERINSWLRTVSIAENVAISSNEVDQLISWAKEVDIRKCLLQLEFLRAGNSSITNGLGFDGRFSSRVWSKLGDLDVSRSSSQSDLLHRCLNLLSVADMLLTTLKTQLKNDNPCQRHWEPSERDSTELISPVTESPNLLTEEMLAYNLSLMDNLLEGQPTCYYNVTKRADLLGDMEQSLVSPACVLSRSAVALDFSPALREIARSEHTRFASQTKRNNRYFHYLRPDDAKASIKMDFELLGKPFTSLPSEPVIDVEST